MQLEMNTYTKILDRLNKFLLILCVFLLMVMVAAVSFQVLLRFLPGMGIRISAPWTSELPIYCMIWLIFLGVAVATRHNKLISVDVLLGKLPLNGVKLVVYIATLLSLLFYIGLLIAGYEWAVYGMSETSSTMGIPMSYVYVSLPVSAFVMILNTIAYLLEIPKKNLLSVNVDTEI
ncbi:TRAP transporter small permease [Sporosarcina highlanderae]|uniref:TRAP transporter small permease n=1 Tax=Sporosarcina highlanderae TaxID=3035916 RepID=A0ABT8JLS6_9BACL|nr:TRAP transporter small permease [Sporosarcina highlanderae]MDN4605887.1 TRAP transporter small permease [Sporosarcina highlanderae]